MSGRAGLTVLSPLRGDDAARRRGKDRLAPAAIPSAYLAVCSDEELPSGVVAKEHSRGRLLLLLLLLFREEGRGAGARGPPRSGVCGHDNGGEGHGLHGP